ncbi:MAG: ABC transporter substrate-binding protein [Gammaproteobacteria bacterium]|nr:ABC transporter substrate-binding protein [Gammaproteobacteria bacterium]
MKSNIKQILGGLVMLMFTSLAFAHPAQDLVESSTREVMDILTQEKEKLENDPVALKSLVDEKIIPHLDFEAMTALSLGKNWREATPEQRNELVTEFKELLLNTYMSALTLYTGQEMEFKPFIPEKRDDRAIVRAVFLQPGNKGVPVNYKLRLKDEQWKIYDIDVNNINLVSTYRSTFAQRVAQVGIDGLIKEIKEKNASLVSVKDSG